MSRFTGNFIKNQDIIFGEVAEMIMNGASAYRVINYFKENYGLSKATAQKCLGIIMKEYFDNYLSDKVEELRSLRLNQLQDIYANQLATDLLSDAATTLRTIIKLEGLENKEDKTADFVVNFTSWQPADTEKIEKNNE